ncbi:EamA family transporter [Aeromicrobium sp. CF3.5]|uniref:EamA family transporter n=1 Tax=Aeromicrobium sp. CF3.5 TaxID=3373078 RepID=UPI003EE4B7AD
MTHDVRSSEIAASRTAAGLTLAVLSALSFSLSGPLAKGLIEAGWTAGSAVTARVLIAAAVLAIPALVALRGRWALLRSNLGLVLAYGTIAVAGCQLAYFNAVDRMQVGVALLIEFTSPVAVLAWMWFRHHQRPSRLTVVGALLAAAGLVLVLDLLSGADVDPLGIVWALGAMAGAAFYWIISGDEDNGLPGIVLAAGGVIVGGVVLLLAGVIGIIPLAASRSDVVLAGTSLPWWAALAALGIVTAALAYVLGIAATRRLGSRLASFVGLSEAVAGVVFAWLLLGETPRSVQLVGGAFILAGVVAVRLGEPKVAGAPPAGVAP